MTIQQLLTLLSGLAWTTVYIDSIRISLKDKSYAMPFWALMLNISWEFLHSLFGFKETGPSLQIIINGIWFLFDIGLLYAYIRYGRKYFPNTLKPVWFPVWVFIGLLTSLVLQYAFIVEFGLFPGATYSAFLQNLLMSILFIVMLIRRGNREGQTMLIAVSKWIGTLAPTLLFGVLGGGAVTAPNFFVLATGTLIAIFDVIYIGMLSKIQTREKHGGKTAHEILFS